MNQNLDLHQKLFVKEHLRKIGTYMDWLTGLKWQSRTVQDVSFLFCFTYLLGFRRVNVSMSMSHSFLLYLFDACKHYALYLEVENRDI